MTNTGDPQVGTVYPAGVTPDEQAEVEAAVKGILVATARSWPDGTERRPPGWHQKWSEDELRIVVREELITLLEEVLSMPKNDILPYLRRKTWDQT